MSAETTGKPRGKNAQGVRHLSKNKIAARVIARVELANIKKQLNVAI